MSEDDTEQARIKRRFPISPVWLIPVMAALIGCWLVYQSFLSRGSEVVLELASAQGLHAGSTPVKVRSVQVGYVESVRLTEDYRSTIAVIQMNPDTEALLAADSQFWVVKPRVGIQGVSGLQTLLSGAYIRLHPGNKSVTADRFTALEHPPITTFGAPGVSLLLSSVSGASINPGDPVVYLGQTVGLVETVTFSVEHKRMQYQVFVRKPYSRIITRTTQFWVRSGINVSIGADGLEVQTGSLESIVMGGVTFGQPPGVNPGESVTDGAHFKLYPTMNAARQDRFDWKIPYVVLFDDSVVGLSAGAPVLFQGLRVGTVKQVPYFTDDFDVTSFKVVHIPVLIEIEPQRIEDWIGWTTEQWRFNLHLLFQAGLRASVETANLLTGAMRVRLRMSDDESGYTAYTIGRYPVFPSAPGTASSLRQQLAASLNKINEFDLDSLVSQLNATLASIAAASHSVNALFESGEAAHLASDLQTTLDALQETLAAYQQGAPVYEQLNQSLTRLSRILGELEPLVETLGERPNALIFGRNADKDPVPQAKP